MQGFFKELTEEEAGGHGNRWETFAKDFADLEDFVLHYAPIVLQDSKLFTVAAQGSFPGRDEAEPEGALLAWPNNEIGVMAVIRFEETEKTFNSMFPLLKGKAEEITIENLMVWPCRLEADIKAYTPEGLELSFFDTSFLKNRFFYAHGITYKFELAGLAYMIERVEPEPFYITNPESIRQLRKLSDDATTDELPLEPIRVETAGMAALIPRQWTSEYEFRAPVKAVEEIQPLMGNRLWRLVITVARPEDHEIEIPLYVTERVMNGWIPKVGEDCQGVLWLQGHCVMGRN